MSGRVDEGRRALTTEGDWTRENDTHCELSERHCRNAARLVAECRRLCIRSDETAETHKKEVEQAFDKRLKDVEFLKTEVSAQVATLREEVDKLHGFRRRLQDSLNAVEHPLYTIQQCLVKRRGRQSIDLVYDEPQRQMEHQVSLIQDVQNILRQSIDQVNEQLRANDSTIRHLNKDITDKQMAMGVDLRATALKPLTVGLEPGKLYNRQPERKTTVDEWESSSRHNIRQGETEILNSRALYPLMEEILTRSSGDIKRQHEATKSALEARIKETRDAKQRLELHLVRVVAEIETMQENLARVKDTTIHKVPLMSVAKLQLETRRQRPHVELCRDQPELQLEKEVSELENAIKVLQQKEEETREMLRMLVRQRRQLEEDVRLRTNTLYIDEVQCLCLLSAPVIIPH